MGDDEGFRLEQSGEGIWLVFGDGKYATDPPRPATDVEIELWKRTDHEQLFIRATAHAYARVAVRVLGETVAGFQLAQEDPETIAGLQRAYRLVFAAAHGEAPE